MSGDFVPVTPELQQYLTSRSTASDPLLGELADETARLGGISVMQIASLQGTFMNLLARSIGARSAVEVGTFTGYSAICVARALPADGRLLCCDVSAEWTAIARRYFDRAGVSPAQVALAWVVAQADQVIPIPGTKTPKYLVDNCAAGDVRLDAEDLADLDALPAPVGGRY